jgi:hypothetical protein
MAAPAGSTVALCERYAGADVESHVTEPPDLCTSRVSSRWGDMMPHVKFDKAHLRGPLVHRVKAPLRGGSFRSGRVAGLSPSHPPSLSEALPAAVDTKERLAYLDDVGGHRTPFVVLSPG